MLRSKCYLSTWRTFDFPETVCQMIEPVTNTESILSPILIRYYLYFFKIQEERFKDPILSGGKKYIYIRGFKDTCSCRHDFKF